MNILCKLSNSIQNCLLTVRDSSGTEKKFFLSASEGDGDACASMHLAEGSFQITLTPQMPDFQVMLEELPTGKWYEKLAKKAGEALLKGIDNFPLRVACTYRIDGLRDGDSLDIAQQVYAYGGGVILELFPVLYLFFEVSHQGRRFAPQASQATNRPAVLKSARSLARMEFLSNFLTGIFAYSIQTGRVKRLTRDRKIQKTLLKFHSMSDEKRTRMLKKLEK